MVAALGAPDLKAGTPSYKVGKLLVTQDVGPFRCTGLKPFILLLMRVFRRIQQTNPALYARIGTAGCLNVRKVRGGRLASNHSWGTAVDLTIGGKLDARGDDRTQDDLTQIYAHFKADAMETGEWVFWGAGFDTEDSMHFEASNELIKKWSKEGKFKV
jgi:hypothetical protein